MLVILNACNRAEKPATVRVISLPYLSNGPFFIAQEEGFFEEQGVTIEFVEMARSSEAIPALEQGEVDVVGGSLSAGLFNAIIRGANIKLVADKGRNGSSGCAASTLMASNSFLVAHPSKNPEDLAGAKIGVNPAGYTGYFTELYLNQGNLSLADIDLFKGKAAEYFNAISDGALDIMVASEPWPTRVMQAGYGTPWITANDIIPGASYAMVWYGPTLLEDNPDLGNRFMVAYLQGVAQFNQGKTDRNLEILTKYSDLEIELVRESCWVTINNDGMINTSDVMDFQEWALRNDLIDALVPEENFWDPRFIEFAADQY